MISLILVCARQSSLEVGADERGIDAPGLRRMLEDWPENRPKPKILYTIPVRFRSRQGTREVIDGLSAYIVWLQPDRRNVDTRTASGDPRALPEAQLPHS